MMRVTTFRFYALFFVPLPLLLLDVGCKSFPRSCDANEEIEVSGNFEGTGPIITSVGNNCILHIKNSKLKGSTLINTEASNLEITLENVTIETTGVMVHSGGMKVTINGSKLTSNGAGAAVFEGEPLEVLEIIDSTIESKGGVAFKSKQAVTIKDAQNAKVRGMKGGLLTEGNIEINMKRGSEITSSDGVAIKTTSSAKLVAEGGGKIDGAVGGIVSTSDTNITATGGLVLSSTRGKAIDGNTVTLDYTDGSITSNAAAAIEGKDNLALTFANVTVQGVPAAINATGSNLKVKATKKTRIVATMGTGIITEHNFELTLNDSSIEATGAGKAIRSKLNTKVKLLPGARVAGKKGGIETAWNFEIDATGAALDGGGGPGIATGSGAEITFRNGLLKGVPALKLSEKPTTLRLDGTKVDGD